jgi:hypothetical protein
MLMDEGGICCDGFFNGTGHAAHALTHTGKNLFGAGGFLVGHKAMLLSQMGIKTSSVRFFDVLSG